MEDGLQFRVTALGVEDHPLVEAFLVGMLDPEGNDMKNLMVEMGLARSSKIEIETAKLSYDSLKVGENQLMILSAASPMEVYVCSQVNNWYSSECWCSQ